jgi:lipopolysaccharide transport system ATP-binding protein
MSKNVIEVSHLSKYYRLGEVGTGTISHDLNRFWHKIRGKEDPYMKLSELNDRSNLDKSDYVWALEDVSFQLEPGDVLGVIGKNGAGKSTLLKILSRITAPSKGSVKLKGRMSSLLEVGTGFHLELTGRENIYLNGAILGMTKREITAKLDEIVDFSGCGKYLDTPVKRYSSGMIVRLGFAVAANLEAEILIVDEVLAVGDQEFQNKCIGKMQDISKTGKTVLFVSHNLTSVKSLCSKGLLIENGRSTYFGDVNSAISNYLQAGVREASFDVDLSDFRNRKGSGLMRFMRAQLYVNDLPGQKLFTGDKLKLRLTLNSSLPARYKIAIHLYRSDETRLSNITNLDSDFVLEPFIGDKTIEVEFDRVMLYTDIYKISLWIGDSTSDEYIDYARHCIEFEIVEGSPILKRSLPKNTGIFFFQPKWENISIQRITQ